MTLRFTLNGRAVEAEPADAEMPVLYLLREIFCARSPSR